MIIDTIYNLGQKVKYKRRRYVEIKCLCEFCGGSGLAKDYKGREVECPDCEGVGYHYDEEKRTSEEEGTIYGFNISENPFTHQPSITYRINGKECCPEDIIDVVESLSEIEN